MILYEYDDNISYNIHIESMTKDRRAFFVKTPCGDQLLTCFYS